ncbi:LysE family translocator [Qipengyuania vesicularis]|uniref:LysE family translocator n=1 Tax=Qipengyuania vesicularis TaxID=2867232 RepID=UPI001C86F034|nr:LysE family translocator [Qipengyuania vesicularis]MBX7527118.1 LysE family translocator [Qipengyuania vesicularis]
MFDPERLIAFAWITALTSIVPGPSMMFVMGQAIWRGPRAGWAALMGMQIGYIVWWIAAALGLATLASAYPLAFKALAVAGVLYLAWLGLQAIRHSFHGDTEDNPAPAKEPSRHAFRDGIAVAIGNPKSLIYVVAIIPPFVDPAGSIGWQIALLAAVALAIDLLIGWIYIGAGKQLAKAMERAATRRWIDRGIGTVFILIAALIAVDLYGTQL